MRIDIAYIVSHGFAARMVMQTNLLGRLVKKGASVALIAPDKEDENLKKYCSENNIILRQFSPQSNFWNSNYAQARMYLLENIKKNPALYEKYIYALRSSSKGSLLTKLKPRLLKLAHDLKEVFPFIKSIFKKRELKMLKSKEAANLINDLNPRLLVSTYPVNYSESMLLMAAEENNVKRIIHLLSWDNISCKGHFPQLADEYIAWGPIMKEELMSYYNIPESHIHVCGVPHFDVHLESKRNANSEIHLQALGLEPNKPYLFFGMSSPRFAPYEIDIVEHLAEKVREGALGKDMQLIVRPHPQNVQGQMADMSWLPRLEALHQGSVAVDFPNLSVSKMPWSMQEHDMIRLSHLLADCEVSLNSGSTLSIDSLMCGKPVILTSFDADKKLEYWESARRLIDYNHLKKLVSLGGISVTKSLDEMKEEILEYTRDSEYKLKEREYTIQQQCNNYSHPATENIVNTFLSILN